jgi:Zn-dependent peptidase ImmA (M78 family)
VKTGKELRTALRASGFSQSAINAAWPDWWDDEADASASSRNELRFSLARKLGLDPRTLIKDDAPNFVWRDTTKYKRLTAESAFEQGALASFGTAIARALIAATPPPEDDSSWSAMELRRSILTRQAFVRLADIVGTCWALGIPVAYLRVFPLSAKRMTAMSVRVGDRYAILVSQRAKYPAPVSFYIAHELGHIAAGHLAHQSALVDVGDILRTRRGDVDIEENEADRFALELLTGSPEPVITTETRSFLARQLAETAVGSAEALAIEPGIIALCFGHNTGRWNKAYGALKHIYGDGSEIWQPVNQTVEQSLDWSVLTGEMAGFVRTVLEVGRHV